MVSIFITVFVALGLAYLLSELCKKIDMPRVVGQVVAGLILGVAVIKQAVFSSESLAVMPFLSDLGIILLFYYIGMKINMRSFTRNIKNSLVISLFNTALPFVLGFAVMHYLLGFDAIASIVVGISLSVSAQAASADLLEELGMLKSRLGSLIVAFGAIDDVIDLVIVTIFLSSFQLAIGNVLFDRLILDFAGFVAIILAARLWILPTALKFFDQEKSSTARFTGALLILLLIAALADFFGIGALIGAMIAGVIVRQTILSDKEIPNREQHDIARSLHIISFGFLIPLFFVWIGISVDTSLAVQNIGLAALLTVLTTIGTVGGTVLAFFLNRLPLHEGFAVGWGLNAKGDVELVIASLALDAGVITHNVFAAIVLMSITTTVVSPVVFKQLLKKHAST